MLCAPLERHIKYLISDNGFGSTLSIFTLKLQWRASHKLGLICYWWCEGHARQRLKEAWHIVCKARTFCVTSDSCMMYCLNSQICLSNSRPIQSHFWKQTSFQSAPSESWHHSKTLLGRNQARLCKHRPWDVIDQLPRSQMQGSHQSMQSNSSKIGLTTWRSASHLKVNCFVTSVFWTATLGHQDLAYGLVSYKWQDCAGGSVLVKSKLLRDVMVWEISLSTQTESLKV